MVIALVVTPEGFPLTYEVFPGNTLDRSTLGTILDTVEQKHGKARRVWVFDRGIVSEDNLALLRARGAHYLVGTPKRKLQACEQRLLDGPWTKASAEVEVFCWPAESRKMMKSTSCAAAPDAKPRSRRCAAAGCAD